jgi:hypothetical protein
MLRRFAFFLVPVALLAGCNSNDADQVKVRLDGSHLVVENTSYAEVCYSLRDDKAGWLPLCTPENRLARGGVLRERIAPSRRGTTTSVFWWRAGERLEGSDFRKADRLREIRVTLDELAQPLPTDEAVVRTCVAIAATRSKAPHFNAAGDALRASGPSNPVLAERDCMALADRACASDEECRSELEHQRAVSTKTEQALAAIAQAPAGQGNAVQSTATAAAAAWDANALASTAKGAFYDLREGRIDSYVERLCPDFRESYRRPDMRDKLEARGREFAARNLEIAKLDESGEGHLIFMAFDDDMAQGKVPATRMPRVRASFEREGGVYCLSLIERLP